MAKNKSIILKKANEYLKLDIKTNLKTVEGMCAYIGISKVKYYDLVKKEKDFADINEKIQFQKQNTICYLEKNVFLKIALTGESETARIAAANEAIKRLATPEQRKLWAGIIDVNLDVITEEQKTVVEKILDDFKIDNIK